MKREKDAIQEATWTLVLVYLGALVLFGTCFLTGILACHVLGKLNHEVATVETHDAENGGAH